MKKTLKEIVQNINDDIDKASNEELDDLFVSLKAVLKEYDHDKFLKDMKDWFQLFGKSKRKKCKLMFIDLVEEIDKPNFSKKEELRKKLLDISNIHRSYLENLISLLSSL